MKQIDFLPARYHQRAVERTAQRWRLIVLLSFGSVVAVAASFQVVLRVDFQLKSRQVATAYDKAIAQRNLHAQLVAEFEQKQQAALLHAYLKHPWPRTRLLAQLIGPLPDSLRLSEIRQAIEAKESARATAGPTTIVAGDQGEAPSQEPPAARDLKRLRDDVDSRQVVYYVAGVTSDAVALHDYVAALAKAPLVAKVDLKSLEAVDSSSNGSPAVAASANGSSATRSSAVPSSAAGRSEAESSKFLIRLVVRQGVGPSERPVAPRPDAVVVGS